jgi:hypothetical protein
MNVLPAGQSGLTLGRSSTARVGFHGKAVALRASSSQAVVTKTSATLTGTLTGTVNGALVDIAATAGSCAGGSTPTATQVDTAIATAVATIVSGANEQIKELQTQLNAAIADVLALTTLVNELRAADVAKGIVKGSA